MGSNARSKQEHPSRSPKAQQNGAKLKKNKDFTSKSLFLKDLAG